MGKAKPLLFMSSQSASCGLRTMVVVAVVVLILLINPLFNAGTCVRLRGRDFLFAWSRTVNYNYLNT